MDTNPDSEIHNRKIQKKNTGSSDFTKAKSYKIGFYEISYRYIYTLGLDQIYV